MDRPSANRTGTQSAGTRRRGFSLVELVTTMGVMVVVMGGIGSAIVIAGRAIDDGTSPAAGTSKTADVLQQITADLSVALRFTEREPVAVTFTVPDRSGNGLPETIRYVWSGVAGDPLARKYNDADPVAIATDVRHFDLTYLLRTSGPPAAPPEIESEEMLLIFHDDAPGGTFQTYSVIDVTWPGTYFFPTLPVNTVNWKITRVKLRLASAGDSDGVVSVQIRTADGSLLPTDSVLDETTVLESSLEAAYAWIDIPFSSLEGLGPTQALCIVTKYVSGSGTVVNVERELGDNAMTPNAHTVRTYNAGGSWQIEAGGNEDLRFHVYGTVTTQGPAEWP